MSFTDQLWEQITPIYDAILAHPFISELSEGRLPREKFLFYMKQDTLYLSDFCRALALTGVHSANNEQMHQFLEFATNVIRVERQLHEQFYERYNTEMDVQKSPACFSYTNFIRSTASTRDNAVAVAALLPCFWIYREVGMHIFEHSAPDNPYQDWIDTYVGEEFRESVEKAIAITNKAASREDEKRKQEMKRAFVRASQMEWMFWDSAYRQEQWPQKPSDSLPVS